MCLGLGVLGASEITFPLPLLYLCPGLHMHPFSRIPGLLPCLLSSPLAGTGVRPGLSDLGSFSEGGLLGLCRHLISISLGPSQNHALRPSLLGPTWCTHLHSASPAPVPHPGHSCALFTSICVWPNFCLFCFVLFPHWNH